MASAAAQLPPGVGARQLSTEGNGGPQNDAFHVTIRHPRPSGERSPHGEHGSPGEPGPQGRAEGRHGSGRRSRRARICRVPTRGWPRLDQHGRVARLDLTLPGLSTASVSLAVRSRFFARFLLTIRLDPSLSGEITGPKLSPMRRGAPMRRRASWVSAYALTTEYTTEAAHFVRRGSRLVQEVPGRSFLGQRRGMALAGTAVEVSLKRAAHAVRR